MFLVSLLKRRRWPNHTIVRLLQYDFLTSRSNIILAPPLSSRGRKFTESKISNILVPQPPSKPTPTATTTKPRIKYSPRSTTNLNYFHCEEGLAFLQVYCFYPKDALSYNCFIVHETYQDRNDYQFASSQ